MSGLQDGEGAFLIALSPIEKCLGERRRFLRCAPEPLPDIAVCGCAWSHTNPPRDQWLVGPSSGTLWESWSSRPHGKRSCGTPDLFYSRILAKVTTASSLGAALNRPALFGFVMATRGLTARRLSSRTSFCPAAIKKCDRIEASWGYTKRPVPELNDPFGKHSSACSQFLAVKGWLI